MSGRTGLDFDAKGLADQPLERRRMPARSPELEFSVARRAQLEQSVLAAVVQFEAGDRLRMAAIEPLGQPQHRRQRADGAARASCRQSP